LYDVRLYFEYLLFLQSKLVCFFDQCTLPFFGSQEKQEEEQATKQPCTIPGYFDPMTINIYFPSPPNEQDSKTANFNV